MSSAIRSVKISSTRSSIATLSKTTLKTFGSRNSKQHLVPQTLSKSNKFAALANDLLNDDLKPNSKEIDITTLKSTIIGIEKSECNLSNKKRETGLSNVISEETSENDDCAIVKTKEAIPTFAHDLARPVYRHARMNLLEIRDWRTGKEQNVNASGYTRPRVGGHRSRITRGRTNGKIFYGISVNDLCQGVLVWHMDTRECYNNDIGANDGQTFKSPDDQLHLRKPRFWYVLSVHEHHFNELPIYTYKGQGIKKKSEELKKQHVGIRPPHVKNYTPQNEYKPLEIEALRGDDIIDPLSVLHFTEQRSTSFDTPIRIIGTLRGSSIAQINKLRAEHGC